MKRKILFGTIEVKDKNRSRQVQACYLEDATHYKGLLIVKKFEAKLIGYSNN